MLYFITVYLCIDLSLFHEAEQSIKEPDPETALTNSQ